MSSRPLLSLYGVTSFYGNIMALKGIDLDVCEGEIVTLIGANGAGKTTLMMTICGNPRAREGHIIYNDQDITNMPTYKIMRQHLSLAPEGRRIFSRMTVLENLQMGCKYQPICLFQRRPRARLRVISTPKRAPPPTRRHIIGWRTTNAFDCTRFNDTPEAFIVR
jgi:ABC-type branched-subunit amino acid transport system ATPase component